MVSAEFFDLLEEQVAKIRFKRNDYKYVPFGGVQLIVCGVSIFFIRGIFFFFLHVFLGNCHPKLFGLGTRETRKENELTFFFFFLGRPSSPPPAGFFPNTSRGKFYEPTYGKAYRPRASKPRRHLQKRGLLFSVAHVASVFPARFSLRAYGGTHTARKKKNYPGMHVAHSFFRCSGSGKRIL